MLQRDVVICDNSSAMQSMLSLPNVPNVIMRALDDYEAQMVHYAHQQHQHQHHQHPHHNNWSPIPYPTYPKYNPIANMCPQMLLSHPGWTMHLFDYEKSRKVILKTINVLQEPIGRNCFLILFYVLTVYWLAYHLSICGKYTNEKVFTYELWQSNTNLYFIS